MRTSSCTGPSSAPLSSAGTDGFVPAATIGADYYRYDERTHSMQGERTGETYRLGDKVQVKLVEAAPVAGALRFELLSQGRYTGKPKGSGKGAKKAQGAKPAKSGPKSGRESR